MSTFFTAKRAFFSLRMKIALLFIVAICCICALFFATHNALRSRAISEELSKISLVTQSVARLSSDREQTDEFLKSLNFKRVRSLDEQANIYRNSKLFFTQVAPFGEIKVFFLDADFYLDVDDDQGHRVFRYGAKIERYGTVLAASCVFSVLILGALFWLIHLGLAPISALSASIRRWSNGEGRDIINVTTNDEIGILAHEFAHAADRIDALTESRHLFLRSVMHELKTPIGKGKIIIKLQPNEQNRARLEAIFTRLELLVNEFGQTERVLSRYYSAELGDYRCSLVLEQALDILMLDNLDRLKIELRDDPIIPVDLQLFSLMLKNLIDNALKYSAPSARVSVVFGERALVVSNPGEVLARPINELMQAFRQGDSNRSGMGLGLYLTDRIARIHNCVLGYCYAHGAHHFIVCREKDLADIQAQISAKIISDDGSKMAGGGGGEAIEQIARKISAKLSSTAVRPDGS